MEPKTMNVFDAPCAHCGATPTLKTRQLKRAERVKALLQTNGIPKDTERLALEKCTRDAPPMLKQYDARIAALKQEMDLVAHERDKLRRHYDDAKTLLHPIRTLPSDLLREVFSWCIPTYQELFETMQKKALDYSSLNASHAPWSLSQVSTSWRTVALSSPLLWSTVAFTVPDSSIKSSKLGKLGFNLALALSRSKNADLHVILDCPLGNDKPVPFAVSIPLQISATRWHYLGYTDNPVLERVLSDMHFDRLHGVDIRSSPNRKASKLAPLRYAPKLRLVNILGAGPTALRAISWGNLSEFECSAPLFNSDIKTLALMTNLVWLRLNDLDDATPTCPPASIPLPKLSDLTLDSNSFSTLFRFAAAFDAPLLTSLLLFYCDSSSNPPLYIASLEVPEFMPRLSMLGLSLPLMSRISNALAVWLRNALVVQTLEVWCSHKEVADGALFDELVVKPDNVLLPRMASLTIHTDDEKALNAEAKRHIVSIMQSRAAEAEGVSVLEEVMVNDEVQVVPDNTIHAA